MQDKTYDIRSYEQRASDLGRFSKSEELYQTIITQKCKLCLNTCNQTFSNAWMAKDLMYQPWDILPHPRRMVTAYIVNFNSASWYIRRQTFFDIFLKLTTLRFQRPDIFWCKSQKAQITTPLVFRPKYHSHIFFIEAIFQDWKNMGAIFNLCEYCAIICINFLQLSL